MRRHWLAILPLLASCAGGGGSDPAGETPLDGPTPTEPSGPSSPTKPGAPSKPRPGEVADLTTRDPVPCNDGCEHFPQKPLLDEASKVTEADIKKFEGGSGSGGLCVLEPQLSSGTTPGALFPSNWLRPRFRWEGAGAGAVTEIRLKSDYERHELVAYTRNTEWAIPRDVWEGAAAGLGTVQVTIKSIGTDGKMVSAEGSFEVTPVKAPGSMVFWAASTSKVEVGASNLYGFSVGDEAVIRTLGTDTVDTTPILHENGRDLRGEHTAVEGFKPGQVRCIGCHTGTPEGDAVVFTDDYPWNKVVSGISEGAEGATPAYISKGAEALLKQPWLGVQTMSIGHWTPGDRILVSSYGMRTEGFSPTIPMKDNLVWFDLETPAVIPLDVPAMDVQPPQPQQGQPPPERPATREDLRKARNEAIAAAKGDAWGIIETMGEKNNTVTPSLSADGKHIAYVSTDRSPNGHPAYEATVADIISVPYNDKKGGAVTPVKGASSPDWLEYYPAFSPDDKFIAFTRAPKRGGMTTDGKQSPDGPYYNRNGEIFVVPSEGGEPVRLVANDPPACTKESSPGVLNSWPKWSPSRRDYKGKSYYFVVFSSARKYPDSFDIPKAQYTPASLDTRSSQLYMAAIVVDEGGKVTTYPAVYLWNQNRLQSGMTVKTVKTSNLTPAWAEFIIPPIPVI